MRVECDVQVPRGAVQLVRKEAAVRVVPVRCVPRHVPRVQKRGAPEQRLLSAEVDKGFVETEPPVFVVGHLGPWEPGPLLVVAVPYVTWGWMGGGKTRDVGMAVKTNLQKSTHF